MATLLVRTDFDHPEAWETLCHTLETPTADGVHADVVTVDDPAYRGLTPEQVLDRAPDASGVRLVAVADTAALSTAELPLLTIDVAAEPPRSLRVVAAELWSIDNNLSLAAMDYEEFADAADESGVFRGFRGF
ncbi:hypothetical protein [Streptomyces sp. NRRL S-87]|uniref:DUF6924 domain-containing protein n=1 Tax=Streptomyces sp. NRRL S-87 TaxID=1463920 RepID=UPI00068AD55D|nr:hypothetical protein [Streptomyces sp. NRRL S-87]